MEDRPVNPDASALERLCSLEAEAESVLGNRPAMVEARNCLSIARGYLELAWFHGAPLNIQAVERELADAALMIGTAKQRRAFLVKLRAAAGWARLEAA